MSDKSHRSTGPVSVDPELLTKDREPPLKGAVHLDPAALEEAEPLAQEALPWESLGAGPDVGKALGGRTSGPVRWGLALMAGLGLVEMGRFLWQQLTDNPVLGGLWSLGLGLVLIGTIGTVWREWRELRRLRRREDHRSRAGQLLARPGGHEGRAFCQQLATETGMAGSEGYERWQAQLDAHHTTAETLSLYSQLVLKHGDELARAQISRWSSEAALLVAMSPLASVDMLLILWRNLRMVEAIAACYGIRLGYWSRIRLIRQIVRHMIYVGAAEVITDVGLDWLGAELSARLSARLAQGVGAGLLTARLGIQTMAICRPLPFAQGERPRLGKIRTELVKQITSQLGKVIKSA